MFGKFHKYNSRNKEYIQTPGIDDIITTNNTTKEITLSSRQDNVKPRLNNTTLVLNGLIGWWRIDEGQGTFINDSSGVGSHGQITGTMSWADGYLGKTVLSTNSIANFINVSPYIANFRQLSQASFSVAFWFRITAGSNSQQGLFSLYESATANKFLTVLRRPASFAAGLYTDKLSFAFWGNDDHTTTAISDNKWHHFVGTYDFNGGARKIYLDNVLESSTTGNAALNFTPTTFHIARFGDTSGMDGSINDFRIYNRVLNANEVNTLYNLKSSDISKLITSNASATNSPALINESIYFVNNTGLVNNTGDVISAGQTIRADKLVGWWPLNEGSGNNAFDRAGNNLTALGNSTITWENDSYIGTVFKNSANRYFETAPVASDRTLGITTAFTVCCWVKSAQSTWNEYGLFITNRVNSSNSMTFNLGGVSGTTQFRFDSYSTVAPNAYAIESNNIPNIMEWNHIAGSYDGVVLRLWVNGVLNGTPVAMPPSLISITTPINIGRDNTSVRILNGSLTDCRIYNATLNQNEIMAIMKERQPLLQQPRNLGLYLSAWWPLNEGSGNTTLDYSGNNRNLTLINNPTWVYTGPNNNKCLDFDSTRSQTANTVITYSLTSNFGITNKLTVSAWIKSTGTTWNVNGAGVSHRAQSGTGYGFILHPVAGTKNISFYTYTSSEGFAQATTINDITQWHHYVGVYNGTYVKIYVDGVLIAASTLSGTVNSTAYPIRVGGDYSGGDRYLNGDISQVRIYNTDLTDIEISALYQESYNNYMATYISPASNNPLSASSMPNTPELNLQLTGQSFANAGYVVDYSGFQHHANVVSSVSYSAVSTLIGSRSLLFNGTTGYLICDGSVNNGQAFKGITGQAGRTFSGWLNPASLSTTRPIISYGYGTNRGIYDIFLDTAGNVNLNLDNSNSSYVYKWDTRLTTGSWQYISLAQDNDGQLTCYKGTTSTSPSTANLATITNVLDSSNLQVWLPLKDGQGTIAYDISGNTTLNNGTLTNASFTTTNSKFNDGTVSFNGTSSYISTNYLPNLAGPYSWSLWVNPNRAGAEMPIISVGDNDGFWEAGEFVYEISSSNILVIGQSGQFALGSSGPLIQSNIWTHLGLAYNGSGTYSLYVNGTLAQTRSNTTVALGATSNSLIIGRYGTGTSPTSTFAYFSGNIADFRAYNSNLSSAAMATLYYNNWNRINTGLGTNNLLIGRGVSESPYVNNYYSGYMDDIRLYSGLLSQEKIINIWSGGSGSYTQESSQQVSNVGIQLPIIPTPGQEIPTSSTGLIITSSSQPLQAPAYIMTTGFDSAFTNKTIIFTPSNTSTYTYATIPTTDTWPPDSIAGHTKVYFSNSDDSIFTLNGSNSLINNFVYYGNEYNYISACTNGHFAIGTADDTQYSESYPIHYNRRRVSLFFNDLQVTMAENPNGVYYGFKSENATNDVCVLTYWGIANLGATGVRSNCQVKMYLKNSPYSGRIVLTYGTVQTTQALAGLSNGSVPTDTSQGTNIAALLGGIGYGTATSVIPYNIYSSNTIVYNYSPGNQNNAYFYGIDSNASSFHLRTGLVGWWKLDESSGGSIYYDASSSGLNGRIQGSTQTINRLISPYNSACLNLEGNTYISAINGNTFPVVGSNLTMSAWFNCSNITTGNNTIIGLNTTGGTDRLPIILTRTANLALVNGSTIINAASNISLNSWNHVAVSTTTGDSTANIRVYLNSQLIATSTTSNTFASTDKLFIGTDLKTATFSDYFNGQLADIRLYNRKLSDNEIKLLYNWSSGLTTHTYTGTYALDLFGSQTGTAYSRRLEQTGTSNSNSLSIACWINVNQPGTHTIASSKSASSRDNGDWQFQAVSPAYDSLKGWWLLNEGTGTTCYDLSLAGFNGSVAGSISWLDTPKTIKGALFNGSTTYITLDSGTGTGLCSTLAGNVISVSAWFNPSVVNVQQCIFGINSNDGVSNICLVYIKTDGTLALFAGGSEITTTRSITANTWNYVAITITGTTYSFYHNSGTQPFQSGSLIGTLQINTNDKAYIGMELDSNVPGDYFNGIITDVRVWSRILTGPELADVFLSNHYLYGSININNSTYTVYDTKPLQLESWRHVGYQYSANPATLTLYLDGQITNQNRLLTANSGQPALLTSNTVIGAISSSGGTISQYFQGYLTDYRQYNSLLPDTEYMKLAAGYYEQAFWLGITKPGPGDKALLTGLIDKATKTKSQGPTFIKPFGEPATNSQTSGQQASNISIDGYELVMDGVNDYLDLSNSYIQRLYNRTYTITGIIKPAAIITQASATAAPATNSYIGYATLNNMLYVFGAFDGTSYSTLIRHFDGTAWYTDSAVLGTARREITCTNYAGFIYLVGGLNGSTYYNIVQRYDGNTLTTLNTFPLSIRSGCLITYKSKLYYIGGATSSGPSSNIYLYDSITDAWSIIATLNTARSFAQAVVYNDLVYIIGGSDSSTQLRSVEIFNGSSCRFSYPLSFIRSYHISTVINGYIYNFGGFVNGTRSSSSIERFDGRTWTTITQTLITGRDLGAGGCINGKFYMYGGYRATGSTVTSLAEYIKPSGAIISKATNNYSCYNLSYDYLSNTYVFETGVGADKVMLSMPALPDNYNHISAVSSGIDGFMGLYLNGVLESSIALPSQTYKGLPNINSSIVPYIGKRSDDEASYFAGTISDIRLWEKVLTPAELANLVPNSSALPQYNPSSSTQIIPDLLDKSPTTGKYIELDDGLIYWLSGDQLLDSTKIQDKSGNNVRANISSGITTGAGRLATSRSIYFNGSSSITIPASTFYNLKQSALSVACWIKFASASVSVSNEYVFYLYGAGTSNNYFDIMRAASGSSYPGELRATFGDSGDSTTAFRITDTNWHHFVITYDGGSSTGTRRSYLDGNLLATGTGKTSLTFSTLPTICQIGTNGSTYFTGNLDDFRIYNRALTYDEIKMLYNTVNNTNYTRAIQPINPGYNQTTYISKYAINNKQQVIDTPLPIIARDNLICNYEFTNLANQSNTGLDSAGYVPDTNWKAKPLANYRTSSYLSNSQVFIPYNYGVLNGNTVISAGGLYMDKYTSSTLSINSGITFNDSLDWSMYIGGVQVSNIVATTNINIWSYTAGSSANNKSLFVNSAAGGEIIFKVGTSTEYNTGIFISQAIPTDITITKGTYGNQSNMVLFYKDGVLKSCRQISLTNDGTNTMVLGPFNGYIQDYKLYTCQLNKQQIQQLAIGTSSSSGPKHMWQFNESNTATTVIRDLGTEGINLVLSNIALKNRVLDTDLNRSNSAISTGCIYFNGTNASAQAFSPGVLRDNPRTITFWLKSASNTNPGTEQRLLDYGDLSTTYYPFSISRTTGSKISVSLGPGTTAVASTKLINNTMWNHVGVVVLPADNSKSAGIGTARNILIYLNGENATDTATWSSATIQTYKTTSTTADWITLGKANNASTNYFTGFMDDVRMYDVALTPQELRGIYLNSSNYAKAMFS